VRAPAAFVAIFLALSAALPVFGEELSANELRERLALLDTELAAERTALDSMRQAYKIELEETRTGRRARAEKLLNLENLRQERLEEERRLLDRIATLDGERAGSADRVRDVGARLRALAERLDVQLSEVPGTDALRAVLPDIEDRLRDPERMASAFDSLLKLADATHARASEIGVSSAEIRTATGELERVELLSAGHMSFAYRVGDRLGLALSSPADASGFRWSEKLDAENAAALSAAFDAVSSGGGKIELPVDVSGTLRVETQEAQRGLWGLVAAGGPVMFPLAFVAMLALVLMAERLAFLVRQRGKSATLLPSVLDACKEGRYELALAACEKTRGVAARTLAACLGRRRHGASAMEDGIAEQLLHELPRLQRNLGGIATLGAVAPLLGLLGTVTGIIQTFGVLKVFSNANPGLMAGGISEALITTATGLIIAIPILLVHSVLSGRVEAVIADAEMSAASLYNALVSGESEAATAVAEAHA
ncbi:MAG: MotA/TolQ/ExbB proton channel family protein, partial [Planctomycetota bacterium]